MNNKISDKTIYDLLGGIYENAKDGTPDSWFEIYNRIADVASSGPGGLSVFVTGSGRFEVVASNLDPASIEQFDRHYQFENPLRDPVVRLKPGQSFSRLAFIPDSEFEKFEIYRDFFRKLDIYEIRYHALGQVPGLAGGLSFSRPRSNPDFSRREVKFLDFVVPHFERGFQLYLLLNEANRENRQMTETLSKIPQSLIVVDASLKVIFRNESAERVICENDGLDVKHGVLKAASARDTRELQSAVSRVLAIDNCPSDPPGLVQLSRPSAKRPLQLLIAPFYKSGIPNYLSETLALIFVFDPELKPATETEILRRIYSLTPAEAQLAALIAQGMSTREVSEALGVTENTVKTHLKRIFSKTETSRQSDLVNLILNGPANLKNHSF